MSLFNSRPAGRRAYAKGPRGPNTKRASKRAPRSRAGGGAGSRGAAARAAASAPRAAGPLAGRVPHAALLPFSLLPGVRLRPRPRPSSTCRRRRRRRVAARRGAVARCSSQTSVSRGAGAAGAAGAAGRAVGWCRRVHAAWLAGLARPAARVGHGWPRASVPLAVHRGTPRTAPPPPHTHNPLPPNPRAPVAARNVSFAGLDTTILALLNDEYVGAEILATGQPFDKETLKMMLGYIRPGTTVVDAGWCARAGRGGARRSGGGGRRAAGARGARMATARGPATGLRAATKRT